MSLVSKYCEYSFLEGVDDGKKEELCELFENFSKYLLNIGNDSLRWGKCDFSLIYIPLILKLFVEYGESDYKKIFNSFKDWYDEEGVGWELTKSDINSLDFIGLYLQHYKSKYHYNIN
jgi:hypothetical protein